MPPYVRIRTADGVWLSARADTLSGAGAGGRVGVVVTLGGAPPQELLDPVARVYFDHHVPRLGREVGPHGWYSGSGPAAGSSEEAGR